MAQKITTIKVTGSATDTFRSLFRSKEEIVEKRQEATEGKKGLGKLIVGRVPAIKDHAFAAEFDSQLQRRQIASLTHEDFSGQWVTTKEGVTRVDISAHVKHPSLVCRLFFDENYQIIIRSECQENGGKTQITSKRLLAAMVDKTGCAISLVIAFFTLIIGGLLFYFSWKKGPKLAEAVFDAFSAALNERMKNG